MKQIKIEVSQENVNYIERLQFEVIARKDVITTLLDTHAKDDTAEILEGKVFQSYSEQLSKLKAEYEIAKNELEKKYIPKEMQGHRLNWNLDFSTHLLTVSVLCDRMGCNDEKTA